MVTKKHRRFTEFADAVRRQRYVRQSLADRHVSGITGLITGHCASAGRGDAPPMKAAGVDNGDGKC